MREERSLTSTGGKKRGERQTGRDTRKGEEPLLKGGSTKRAR